MSIRTPLRFVASLCALGLCTGCAMGPTREDPFEPMNRASYKFSTAIDNAIVKPVAQAYVSYTPSPVRTAVSNFFGNIDDLFSFVNDLLQGKPDKAGNDLGRVIANTGFGMLGLVDIASEAGVPKGQEDFGQTFGVWGIAQGPYLFVPLFGPTTFRDGTGSLIRGFADPINYIHDVPTSYGLWGLHILDLRAQALGTENVLNQAALDPYTFIRRAYLQRREYLVWDGKPPPAGKEEQ